MRIKLIVLFLISSIGCFASSEKDLMNQAAEAYGKGDYIKSVSLYQQIASEYGANSALYYNLGNAYTKLENYGSAVLNYRKSLKLKPYNSDAKRNLAYVEEKVSLENETLIGDKNLDPTPEQPSFLVKVRKWLETPGSNGWAWISASLFILCCVGVFVYYFIQSGKWRKIAFFTALPALILSVFVLLLSFSAKQSALAVNECVLMVPQAKLKTLPTEDAKELEAPLAGGTTFRILEEKEDADKNLWVKVRLNDDFTGWLPAEAIGMVKV